VFALVAMDQDGQVPPVEDLLERGGIHPSFRRITRRAVWLLIRINPAVHSPFP
jgi:hypothetical protein